MVGIALIDDAVGDVIPEKRHVPGLLKKCVILILKSRFWIAHQADIEFFMVAHIPGFIRMRRDLLSGRHVVNQDIAEGFSAHPRHQIEYQGTGFLKMMIFLEPHAMMGRLVVTSITSASFVGCFILSAQPDAMRLCVRPVWITP